jgi:hypothetical protein
MGNKNLLLALVCVLALGACLYVIAMFIAHLVLLADQVIAFLFGLALIN